MTIIKDTPPAGDSIVTSGVPTEQFYAFLESVSRAINMPKAPSFTVSSVPPANESEAVYIYVTDEVGGKTLAFSNGVNWLRTYDMAVIS